MTSEPSLEHLLERFVSGGWDSLADLGANARKPNPEGTELEFARIAAAAARVAATDDGRKLIDWILDLTLRKASWHGQIGLTVEQITTYGLLREGQNSLAALIVGAILKGRGAAPPPARDTGA